MNVYVLLLLTTTIGLLSNVIANWIAPSLEQRRLLTVIVFASLSILSVIIVNNQSEENNDELKNSSKNSSEEQKSIKHKEPEKLIRDTIRIIEKYPQEKTETYKINKAELLKNNNLVIKDIDDNKYKTFKFQNLIWLSENMKITAPGEEMFFADDALLKKYGRFYSLEGAKQACKSLGKHWRLPTVTEYQNLLLQDDGGYAEEHFFGNKAIGNPTNAYINNSFGGKSGFNSLLSGYGFSFRNQIQGIGQSARYWAINITGNPDQIESNKKYYFYTFIFNEQLKEVTQLEHFDLNLGFFNSCRCVIKSDSL